MKKVAAMPRFICAIMVIGLLCVACNYAGEGAPVQKKILMVYYSRTGTTEKVAKEIAARLRADIETLVDQKDRSGVFGALGGGKDATFSKLTELGPLQKDPADYDLVIMGTPIWAGTMTPAIRTYISQHGKVIKKYAFFTTAGGDQPQLFLERMEKTVGSPAVAYTGFSKNDRENGEVYEQKIADFVRQVR